MPSQGLGFRIALLQPAHAPWSIAWVLPSLDSGMRHSPFGGHEDDIQPKT
jgi:hypothetical protein